MFRYLDYYLSYLSFASDEVYTGILHSRTFEEKQVFLKAYHNDTKYLRFPKRG